MTRTYAAKRLLEHGALTFREFREITGWKPRQASNTLKQLVLTGTAKPVNPTRSRHTTRHYALASLSIADGWPNGIETKLSEPSTATTKACHG